MGSLITTATYSTRESNKHLIIKLLWIGLRSVASRLLSRILHFQISTCEIHLRWLCSGLAILPIITSGNILAKSHILGWCVGLWWPFLLQRSDVPRMTVLIINDPLLLLPDSKGKGTRCHTERHNGLAHQYKIHSRKLFTNPQYNSMKHNPFFICFLSMGRVELR